MFQTRRFLSYAVAILCLVASGFHLFADTRAFTPANTSNEVVSSWELRMKPVRQALPPDVFIAGYLESSDLSGALSGFDQAGFFMTQYALAPVVLRTGFGQNWIIGNFGKQVAIKTVRSWLSTKLGNYTIQDFGSGIYLVHRLGE